MIRLSVLYPSPEGATFDHDYYRDQHVPLAMRTWGLNRARRSTRVSTDRTSAAVHFRFDSLKAMGAAMAVDGTADIMADVANYTTIQPVLQTSEIV